MERQRDEKWGKREGGRREREEQGDRCKESEEGQHREGMRKDEKGRMDGERESKERMRAM